MACIALFYICAFLRAAPSEKSFCADSYFEKYLAAYISTLIETYLSTEFTVFRKSEMVCSQPHLGQRATYNYCYHKIG